MNIGYDCVVMNLKEAIQQGGAEPFYSIKKNNTDHIVNQYNIVKRSI